MDNSMKRKHTNKHKSLKHSPQEESAKAAFAEPKAKVYDPSDFKI